MIQKTLIFAVAYIRMSSGKQEASPAQQRREVQRLAEKYGYKIIREYFDDGISGDATEKRKAFQQMIRDAEEKGDFSVILCWDQDRFGRFDSIEAGRWIHPLRQAGVRLVTCGQGEVNWEDFAGRMIYSIQQEGKHQFLRDLSKNVVRGKAAKMKAGTTPPTAVYGYDRLFFNQSGKLMERVPYGEKFTRPTDWTVKLSPAEEGESAKTVKWLFDTYAAKDCGVQYLVSELNKRGVPSPKGSDWSWVSVRYLLGNPVYMGDKASGRRKKQGKYHSIGKNGDVVSASEQTCDDGEPLFLHKGTHKAIVSRTVFGRVQQKLASRKITRSRPRTKGGYLLTGVLHCGHCGGRMYGGPGGSQDKPRYVCDNGNQRKAGCRAYQVLAEQIEPLILKKAVEAITSPDTLPRIHKEIERLARARKAPTSNTRPLKAKLRAIDKKIDKGTENLLLADAEAMPAMSKMLADWREQRANLQAELDATAIAPFDVNEVISQAKVKLRDMLSVLQNGETPEVRAVVKAIMSKVTLNWNPVGKQHRVAKGSIEYSQSVVIQGTS